MRELPNLWQGPLRVQWACALMERIGERSLKFVPLLMSGLRAVTASGILAPHAQAIATAREIISHYTTRRAIQQAVNAFRDHVSQVGMGSYTIDPKTLCFHRVHPLIDPDVRRAQEILDTPLPHRQVSRRIADPNREMHVRLSDDPRTPPGVIKRLEIPIPSPPQHDLEREPSSMIAVPLDALEHLAEDMDSFEAQHPEWPRGNWHKRLQRTRLLMPHNGGLAPTDVLTLDGVKHLLGLPGAGKTTLLVLLGLYLAQRGYRLAMLCTSIEVARQYAEMFDRHGARVGLLVGQGALTRARHARRIAETIAVQGDGGFAHTLFGADLFGASCVLPAFSVDDESHRGGWWLHDPPCTQIWQKTPDAMEWREHLCPLWSACGRNKGVRALVDANVWLGHVISMDTRVSWHASKEQRRYFELIADTFDLVIFDECDLTQSVLDAYGAARLDLSGREGSLHEVIEKQVLAPFAGAQSHRLSEVNTVTYARQLAEFGIHNHMLAHTLHALYAEDARTLRRFENQFLTTARIIQILIEGKHGRSEEAEDQAEARRAQRDRVDGLCEFWDSSVYAAFFDRNDTQGRHLQNANACARAVGINTGVLQRRWLQLSRALRAYLAEDSMSVRDDIIQDIACTFLPVAFPGKDTQELTNDECLRSVRLLTATSMMILAYKRIVFAWRELTARGVLDQELTLSLTASHSLRHRVPHNILGDLAGVRFEFEHSHNFSEAQRVHLSYLALEGAPRLLMHRFHELGRPGRRSPNVLLTSATSFLEASPAYHVAHGPHYILSPQEREYDPDKNRYVFRPVVGNGEALRYSGAGVNAERNLERMLAHLVEGGSKSEIYRQRHSFDVLKDETGSQQYRKVGIVVNSYAHVRQLIAFLHRQYPEVARCTVGVVDHLLEGERREQFVTPAMVEHLGDDERVHILIFPMLALGRGVNIVFTDGRRKLKAAIGTLYFLTRPHPASDDLTLLYGLAAQATQELDMREHLGESFEEMQANVRRAKHRIYNDVARLLQEPLRASRLNTKLFRAFTADQMVPILQTIGRAMRGGSPVQVFFVDAAWAPASAYGGTDHIRSSMLVMMRAILEECLEHTDPAKRAVYRELYAVFLEPLRHIQNVNFPASFERYALQPLDTGAFEEDENDRALIGPSPHLLDNPDEFATPLVPDDDLKIPSFHGLRLSFTDDPEDEDD